MSAPQIDDGMQRAIREAFARLGSKTAVARELSLDRNTVRKYLFNSAPSPAAPSLESRLARIEQALDRLLTGDEPQAPDEPEPGIAAPAPDFGPVLKALRGRSLAAEEMAALAGVSVADAHAWAEEERRKGLNLHQVAGVYAIEKRPTRTGGEIIEVVSDDDNTFTLGALGDSHLGSKYERLDVLNDLYDEYARAGVRSVFHTGNWIDGEAKFNKFELKVHGMDAQVRYLAEHYPRRPGIDTYAVAGDDHEGWYCQREGVDIGRHAQRIMHELGRTDWHDLGYMEAFVKLVNKNTGKHSFMLVVHPGGGTPYATSYTMQKFVEGFSGGEKPAVLLAGHYHKMEILNCRNVWCIQTGCQQDQNSFARKKKIEFHVGGHLLRMKQHPESGAIVELNGMRRYFNVGFYNARWSHSEGVILPRMTLGGVD